MKYDVETLEMYGRWGINKLHEQVEKLDAKIREKWDDLTPERRERGDVRIRNFLKRVEDLEADMVLIRTEYDKPVHKSKKRFAASQAEAADRLKTAGSLFGPLNAGF